MTWKATGQPTVRKQRGKWVVRIDGFDTSTGKHQPHQIGTYLSQRSALAAAREHRGEAKSTERGTVSWLVRRYARVALPRTVAKPAKEVEVEAWEAADITRFRNQILGHRWEDGFRLGVLYGLRRSEVLALRWDDLDARAKTLRIDESLVALNRGASLGDAKNKRSRRPPPRSVGREEHGRAGYIVGLPESA